MKSTAELCCCWASPSGRRCAQALLSQAAPGQCCRRLGWAGLPVWIRPSQAIPTNIITAALPVTWSARWAQMCSASLPIGAETLTAAFVLPACIAPAPDHLARPGVGHLLSPMCAVPGTRLKSYGTGPGCNRQPYQSAGQGADTHAKPPLAVQSAKPGQSELLPRASHGQAICLSERAALRTCVLLLPTASVLALNLLIVDLQES